MSNSIVQHIISSIPYATIATVDGAGNPWNTPVFCAVDQDNSIYWSSHPESVHSKNIESNHRAFIVIYNSRAEEGEGVGLYLRVMVEMIEDKTLIQSALDVLGTRRGKPFLDIGKFLSDGPQRIYKAVPIEGWINDADKDQEGDFIKDYRIPVDL